MNGRVYDPRIGRFVSPDPIRFSKKERGNASEINLTNAETQADARFAMESNLGENLYAYAWNSPLSHVDPSGFHPVVPLYNPLNSSPWINETVWGILGESSAVAELGLVRFSTAISIFGSSFQLGFTIGTVINYAPVVNGDTPIHEDLAPAIDEITGLNEKVLNALQNYPVIRVPSGVISVSAGVTVFSGSYGGGGRAIVTTEDIL